MTDTTPQEVLLRRLLALHSASDAENHPTDEVLALFAAGDLAGDERNEVVAHLAECSICRQIVSGVLAFGDGPTTSAPRVALQNNPWYSRPQSWAVVAAGVLLLICSTIAIQSWTSPSTEQSAYLQAKSRLEAGDFGAAREVVAAAAKRGHKSDRLLNLDAQAIRRMNTEIALARAGELDDFGYQLGGIVARSTPDKLAASQLQAAIDILEGTAAASVPVLLNRGQILLVQGKTEAAKLEFEKASQQDSQEPLAWLGIGIAEYSQDNFAGAEAAFRRALVLDSNNLAAAQNLAMTLEELNRIDEAVALWQQLLPRLPEGRHAAVTEHLRQLAKDRP